MADITGVVRIKVNGQTLRSKEGAELDPGGVERTPHMNGRTFYGMSEKGIHAMVTCTLAHKADTDLVALSAIENATIIFETDTGDSYLISQASVTKPAKLSGEGEVAMEFAGAPAERL